MTRDAGYIPASARAAYPLRAGNSVRPLVDGEPAFRRISEAVEAARHSVWVTVAFLERDVQMPDGRGSFFDVLDAAAARGLDVRVLFWREPRLREQEPDSDHFQGNAEEREWLEARGSGLLARWDHLPDGFCQHQKSWLVDAGQIGEIAFVGGINLDQPSVSPPGHDGHEGEHVHDVYVELRGPSATDVHHNFVQRWNGASERSKHDGAWPSLERAGDLEFPALLSPAAGDAPIQIQRTVLPGRYRNDTAPPGGKPYPIDAGETSVYEQYLGAIAAARGSIYIEDQTIGSPAVVDGLQAAVDRGVEVVFLVPGNAHPAFAAARKDPRVAFFFENLAKLDRHERFTLAAIATSRGEGRYGEVYVHAKIALVDDAWATIGSTNIAERSFQGDTELNASFWHAPTVRALREELLREHIGRDTSDLDDRAALRLYREVAHANLDRRASWQPKEGLAYALDVESYGT